MTVNDSFVSELLHLWNILPNVVQSLRVKYSARPNIYVSYIANVDANSRPILSLRRDEEAVAYTRILAMNDHDGSACVCSQRSLSL